MTPEQRQELMRLLKAGEEISPEWARVLFPPEKREYELVYHGKDREEDIIADTLAVPLQPVRTFGRNGVDWHNMLIFGDNLQAMKTLLEMKKEGKLCNADGTPGVRLVYIDPPFATKQEFRGTQDQKAYQDKVEGAAFLEFLRKRLIYLRELLSDDGSLFLHLDWRKGHHAKIVADEVFGENNFAGEIIWKRSTGHAQKQSFGIIHDTIYHYRRSATSFVWNPQFDPHEAKHIEKYYSNTDPDGRRYTLDNLTAEGPGPARMFFKKLLEPPAGTHWRYSQDKIDKHSADGFIVMTAKDRPRFKRYLDSLEGRVISSIWMNLPAVNSQAAEDTRYPTQKPEILIDRIVKSSAQEGDLVLDAFAGSGTTLAVAEKRARRWIGLDCGKLAIYTIQNRMLNLRRDIGNKGPKIESKPFTLYNGGLYDFSKLKELSWQDWRFFALQLFQCRDEIHKIGGIDFDGYRLGASVMVFNHMEAKHKDARITEDTIQEIHEAVGSRVGSKVFIIAPALAFDFQQDYVDIGVKSDKVRYYALRIPYSIIHELHRREFTALKQPSDEMAVNDTVEAVGFDFIRTPELKYKTGTEKPKGELFAYGFIKIETFKSDAVVREPFKKKGNLETLSMVLLDFDYDDKSNVFDLDEVHYAEAIENAGWKVRFGTDHLGDKIMAVFLDIYGNEARVLINATEFGKAKAKIATKKKSGKKK